MKNILINVLLILFFMTSLNAAEVNHGVSQLDTNVLYRINTEKLNIRMEPNVDSKVLGNYDRDEEIRIFDQNGIWVKTDRGWISSRHIEIQEESLLITILTILFVCVVIIVILIASWPWSGVLLIPLFLILFIITLILLVFFTPVAFFVGYLYWTFRNLWIYKGINKNEIIKKIHNIENPGTALTSEESVKLRRLKKELEQIKKSLHEANEEAQHLNRNKDGSISARSHAGKEMIATLEYLEGQYDELENDIEDCQSGPSYRQARYQEKIDKLKSILIDQHEDKEIAWSFLIALLVWLGLLVYFSTGTYDINTIQSITVQSITVLMEDLLTQYISLYKFLLGNLDVSFDYVTHSVLVAVPVGIFFLSKYLFTFMTFTLPKKSDKLNEKSDLSLKSELILASESGDFGKVKQLIESGVDINMVCESNKFSALHYACMEGHIEIVKYLIYHSADMNLQGYKKWTPLYRSIVDGYPDIALLLIEKGADLTKKDADGWTPLHRAIRDGYMDISHKLVEKGADVNAQNNQGWTPLHIAIADKHVDFAKYLVAHGSDLNIKNKADESPLDFARQNGVEITPLEMNEFEADLFYVTCINCGKTHTNPINVLCSNCGKNMHEKDTNIQCSNCGSEYESTNPNCPICGSSN